MRCPRQKGFMLLMAVAFIALISLSFIILYASILDISTQTFLERLRIQRENIFSTADVWTYHNKDHFTDKQPGYEFELSTETLNIPNSSCTVTLKELTADHLVLNVTAVIAHGQKEFEKDNEVKVSLQD